MRFVQPETLEEACETLASDAFGSKAIAGGTAVVLMMRQGLIAPDTLVSLGGLEDLRGIESDDRSLMIGARTTLSEVSASPQVRDVAASLASACGRVGNVRVRNIATLGGNVAEADYASDPPSVLVSLDAQCLIRGPSGDRAVAVSDIITGFYSTALEPGEIITQIVVPRPGELERRLSYQKYVSRSSEDRPCVGVAVRADLDGREVAHLSVIVGAVASVPQRLSGITARAAGRSLDRDLIDEIAAAYAEAIDPMDDARGSGWYRRQIIEVFVRRALEEVAT